MLAAGYVKIGECLIEMERPNDAIDMIQSGLEMQKEIAESSQDHLPAQKSLVFTIRKLAAAYEQQGNLQLAIKQFENAENHLQSMIGQQLHESYAQSTLKNMTVRIRQLRVLELATGDLSLIMEQDNQTIPKLLRQRASFFLDHKEFDKAAVAAEKLIELKYTNKGTLYNAAKVLSRCADSIAETADAALSEEQETKRKKWADASLEGFKRALEKGWNSFDLIENENDLNAIRDRPDFKLLVDQAQADEQAQSDSDPTENDPAE